MHHTLLANDGRQSGSDWVAVPTYPLASYSQQFSTYFVPQSGQHPIRPALP